MRSIPIAFRLKPDTIALCDAAADDLQISRNKIVERTLREGLDRYSREVKGRLEVVEVRDEQPDLFA